MTWRRRAPWLVGLAAVLLLAAHGAALYAAWSTFAIPALIVVVAIVALAVHTIGGRRLAHLARPDGSAQFVRQEVRAFPRDVTQLRVAPIVSSQEILRRLEQYTFARPMLLSDALRDVADMLRSWTLHSTHPRYFGLFNPGVHEAGIWGDTLAALYNPQLGAWWHAPAANEIERHTLDFLADVIGFEAEFAQFTTGGSEANLTALLAAIGAAFPDARDNGVGEAASRGVVYVSSQAHHSIHKAMRVTGLGTRALRVVPCDVRQQMDIAALRRGVDHDVRDGRKPIMIVATFGTTTSGAIDDIGAVCVVAREHAAWTHVDAAWGGTAAFSPRLRPLLRAVREADSLTWDAHKWLSVPMGAGMFFCRHEEVAQGVFSGDATYVPKRVDEGDDLYLTSLQWSRRFIGLKLFLTLATTGRDAVGVRIERQLDVADHLRRRLQGMGWTIVNETPLPLVCFTHPVLKEDADHRHIAQQVAQRGRAWISSATLPGGPVLRACITHDDCSPADVDVLCNELELALQERP